MKGIDKFLTIFIHNGAIYSYYLFWRVRNIKLITVLSSGLLWVKFVPLLTGLTTRRGCVPRPAPWGPSRKELLLRCRRRGSRARLSVEAGSSHGNYLSTMISTLVDFVMEYCWNLSPYMFISNKWV